MIEIEKITIDGEEAELTQYAKKKEVSNLSEEIVDLPNEERVSEMIDEALGVIENGTY